MGKTVICEVFLYSWNINLKESNDIIKLHSLIRNQLSAPIFNNLISYSWFRFSFSPYQIKFNDV